YNYLPLRAEIERQGHVFRGHSDTEVMLESIARIGIEATIKQLIGMFAIAIWDRRDRTLTLVRDRLGIKPVYWSNIGSVFLFGSELKALKSHPQFSARIDQSSVAAYMRHNYVPAPRTIYEDVFKLEPGTILTLPWGGEPRTRRYWDAHEVARSGNSNQVRL